MKRFNSELSRLESPEAAAGGLDIEDYVLDITAGDHRLNIGGGLHTTAGGKWNAVWKSFFDANPGATGTQILGQLADMMDSFPQLAKYL